MQHPGGASNLSGRGIHPGGASNLTGRGFHTGGGTSNWSGSGIRVRQWIRRRKGNVVEAAWNKRKKCTLLAVHPAEMVPIHRPRREFRELPPELSFLLCLFGTLTTSHLSLAHNPILKCLLCLIPCYPNIFENGLARKNLTHEFELSNYKNKINSHLQFFPSIGKNVWMMEIRAMKKPTIYTFTNHPKDHLIRDASTMTMRRNEAAKSVDRFCKPEPLKLEQNVDQIPTHKCIST